MKRFIVVLLTGVLGLGIVQMGPTSAEAASKPVIGSPKLAVLVDGRKVKFDGGDPVMESGRVQVPLRGIGEALGAEVGYSGKTVTYTKDGKSIVLTLGSNMASVDGQSVTMDTVAKAVKGRTYVPLRFVSENLGETVSWDQIGNWVWIGSKEVPTPEEAGIKEVNLDDYKKMLGKKTYLLDKKKSVRIFTVDDLPLKLNQIIVYDIWEVKQGNNEGIQARFGRGGTNIFYLSSNDIPRFRTKIGKTDNKDETFTLNFNKRSEIDEIIDGDVNYKQFNISETKFIGMVSDTESLELLENPFN